MSFRFARVPWPAPPVWLALRPPMNAEKDVAEMVALARQGGAALDLTACPALWSPHLGAQKNGTAETWATPALLSVSGGGSLRHANGGMHAADLISAEIVQLISALEGRRLGVFWWRVSEPVSSDVADGVFGALELARSDRLVQAVGLQPVGDPGPALALWSSRDGFDIVRLPFSPSGDDPIGRLASQRSVGVVREAPSSGVALPAGAAGRGPVLVPASSPEEVKLAFEWLRLA